MLAAVTQLPACSGGAEDPPLLETPMAPSSVAGYHWPLNATVTLTSEGPNPASVIINVGGRVTFVNRDVRPHEIVSDPYLRHDDCPAINRVGFLVPGQQAATGIFETVRTCGFHDHLDHTKLVGHIDVRIE
jgi:plastocyanin